MSLTEYYDRVRSVCRKSLEIAGQCQESGSCFYLHKFEHDTYYRTLWCFSDTNPRELPKEMVVEEYSIETGEKTYEVNLLENMSNSPSR